MNVATEILNQLGGSKFIAMTGSKNFAHDNDGKTLIMNLRTNKAKAKYLTITLNSMDTYDMTFSTLSKMQLVIIEELKGVYATDLQKIFTQITGLDTKI